jgi:hypothetical protein
MMKRLSHSFCFPTFLILGVCGCGMISTDGTGGSTAPNDARPTSTPLKQAQIMGQNGKSASGTASVFFSGSGAYIIRLEGISVTSESGLAVQVYATPGGRIGNFQLRATSGSQNYSLSNSVNGLTFNSVAIYSSVNNINYGSAVFE